jgi:hypothetical protein
MSRDSFYLDISYKILCNKEWISLQKMLPSKSKEMYIERLYI